MGTPAARFPADPGSVDDKFYFTDIFECVDIGFKDFLGKTN